MLASAVFLGTTDMDALTLSMSRVAGDPEDAGLAANPIAVGVLSNTWLKLGLTVALGAGTFRRRASLGLATLALASGIGLWLGRVTP